MNYLEEAKKELENSLRIEDPAYANQATFSAIAHALIALVEKVEEIREATSVIAMVVDSNEPIKVTGNIHTQ